MEAPALTEAVVVTVEVAEEGATEEEEARSSHSHQHVPKIRRHLRCLDSCPIGCNSTLLPSLLPSPALPAPFLLSPGIGPCRSEALTAGLHHEPLQLDTQFEADAPQCAREWVIGVEQPFCEQYQPFSAPALSIGTRVGNWVGGENGNRDGAKDGGAEGSIVGDGGDVGAGDGDGNGNGHHCAPLPQTPTQVFSSASQKPDWSRPMVVWHWCQLQKPDFVPAPVSLSLPSFRALSSQSNVLSAHTSVLALAVELAFTFRDTHVALQVCGHNNAANCLR